MFDLDLVCLMLIKKKEYYTVVSVLFLLWLKYVVMLWDARICSSSYLHILIYVYIFLSWSGFLSLLPWILKFTDSILKSGRKIWFSFSLFSFRYVSLQFFHLLKIYMQELLLIIFMVIFIFNLKHKTSMLFWILTVVET